MSCTFEDRFDFSGVQGASLIMNPGLWACERALKDRSIRAAESELVQMSVLLRKHCGCSLSVRYGSQGYIM